MNSQPLRFTRICFVLFVGLATCSLSSNHGLGFVNTNWEKWASNSVGSNGQSLKAALLINYDRTGPSRLLSTVAEEEGIEADPTEVNKFVSFIKRGNYQSESFFIESNQYVTSIHESWFCGRCMNTSKPADEGAIVYTTPSFLFVALYDGSIGAASSAMAAVDRFEWQLERINL